MKQFIYSIVTTACLLCISPAHAQLQADSNSSASPLALYPQGVLKSELLLWRSAPDSLTAFARVPMQLLSNSDSVQLQLLLLNSLDSTREAYDSLPLQPILSSHENHLFFTASIPYSDRLHYLVLEGQSGLKNEEANLAMAVLDPEQSFPPPSFYLTKAADSLPVMQNYMPAGQPLFLHGSDTTYTVFLYKKAFELAAPPMSADPTTSDALAVDSLFQLSTDSAFTLAEEGLYFIQKDTSQMRGQSIRITNPFYPEVGTLKDLSSPIRYISTREEWRRLEESNFSQEALDRFWLKIGKTEERAKKMIKGYYQAVEAANRYFTNYKEGWKTDRGMIYILYGPPNVVNVREGQEEWIYRKTAYNPEIKFTFVRVKNPFTDKHLVLIRRKEYTKAHYDTISQWRRGRKTL